MSIEAKFGKPPALPGLTPAKILSYQFVVCVALLVVIQPPFVIDFHADGTRVGVSLVRVLLASGIAVGATIASKRSFKIP